MNLLKRIHQEIEYIANKEGVNFPSDEVINISLVLTKEEEEEFFNLTCDLLSEEYFYDIDTDNHILSIAYCNNKEV